MKNNKLNVPGTAENGAGTAIAAAQEFITAF